MSLRQREDAVPTGSHDWFTWVEKYNLTLKPYSCVPMRGLKSWLVSVALSRVPIPSPPVNSPFGVLMHQPLVAQTNQFVNAVHKITVPYRSFFFFFFLFLSPSLSTCAESTPLRSDELSSFKSSLTSRFLFDFSGLIFLALSSLTRKINKKSASRLEIFSKTSTHTRQENTNRDKLE